MESVHIPLLGSLHTSCTVSYLAQQAILQCWRRGGGCLEMFTVHPTKIADIPALLRVLYCMSLEDFHKLFSLLRMGA